MSAKSLPPDRPPGMIDLLATAESHPSDPSWRADALARSRHSRLADEVREPLHDADPVRAESVCAEIARNVLGDFAPALLLLSADRRRRAQVLTAWTVALFDLALRPGLAGLDGDRLAHLNAWEFRTEEALDGRPPGQPVFVMLAHEEAESSWPREALDRLVAAARTTALGGSAPDLGITILEALFAPTDGDSACHLAPLVDVAIARQTAGETSNKKRDGRVESVRAVPVARAPAGWSRAASYAKRALLSLLDQGDARTFAKLGLARRLALLALSFARPR